MEGTVTAFACALAVYSWVVLGQAWDRVSGQAPHLCLDGRPRELPLSEAAYAIEHKGDAPTVLSCRWELFVYEGPDATDPTVVAAQPRRLGRTPLECGADAPACDEPAWLCGSEPCTADQFAAHRCAYLLRPQAYVCWAAFGLVQLSQLEEPPHWAWAVAVLLSLVAGWLLCIGAGGVAEILDEEEEEEEEGGHVALCGCALGPALVIALVFVGNARLDQWRTVEHNAKWYQLAAEPSGSLATPFTIGGVWDAEASGLDPLAVDLPRFEAPEQGVFYALVAATVVLVCALGGYFCFVFAEEAGTLPVVPRAPLQRSSSQELRRRLSGQRAKMLGRSSSKEITVSAKGGKG